MVPAENGSRDLPDLSDIDRLIHEPARLVVMALLSVVQSADFLFLLRQTGLTQGNLSSHLSKLEEAGYHNYTGTLGCVSLYPAYAQRIYTYVNPGTHVRIVE